MREFKIGDKVQVKTWKELVDEFGITDEGSVDCGDIHFIEEMKYLCGEVITITENNFAGEYIEIDSKEDVWSLTPDMVHFLNECNSEHNHIITIPTHITPWIKPLKVRGFEVVSNKNRKYPNEEISLPVRGDSRSAGYDISTPVRVVLNPNERKLISTDIKAYMQEDEVLELYIRSSIGVKKNIIFSNTTGIIDSSYYDNISNDGNIGLTLWNTSNEVQVLEAGERVCQGIFKKYLTVDNDICLNNERTGGFGSSGK